MHSCRRERNARRSEAGLDKNSSALQVTTPHPMYDSAQVVSMRTSSPFLQMVCFNNRSAFRSGNWLCILYVTVAPKVSAASTHDIFAMTVAVPNALATAQDKCPIGPAPNTATLLPCHYLPFRSNRRPCSAARLVRLFETKHALVIYSSNLWRQSFPIA